MLVLPYVSILHLSASIRQRTPHSQTPVTGEQHQDLDEQNIVVYFWCLKGTSTLFCYFILIALHRSCSHLYILFSHPLYVSDQTVCVVVLHYETVEFQINCMS